MSLRIDPHGKTSACRYAALALLLVLLAPAAAAASGVLNGSLGRWLDTEAAPQLGEMLGKHPRFQGETIRVVSMRDGKPVPVASRLHRAVQDHLTQRLLGYDGVRIAWAQPTNTCGVPQTVPYLLGIEIEQTGSQRHALNVAMVDVADSVWVNGVNFSWKGRLTSAERIALAGTVDQAPQGTVDSPLPAGRTSDVAAHLERNVRCALPDGLDGPVFLAPTQAGQLSRIRGQLQGDLAVAAIAAITPRQQDAEWTLSLEAHPVSSRTQELVLTLTDREDALSQQVASVFVVGLPGAEGTPPTGTPTLVAGSALLSDFHLDTSASGGVCNTHSSHPNACAEITFDLLSPAYLFVLSTHDRTLKANSCSTLIKRADAGERRFRLRVPELRPAGARDPAVTADAGFYAIAVRERSVARALARHIHKAPGTCSRHSRRGLDTWLRQLDALLAPHADDYEWRAMHLASSPGGVVQL